MLGGNTVEYTLAETIINYLFILFTSPLRFFDIDPNWSEVYVHFWMLANSLLWAVILLIAYRMLRKIKRGRTRTDSHPESRRLDNGSRI